MNQKIRYLLSIESAIAGGSIALFANEAMIAERSGDGSISRAEDLLPNIISILADGDVSKGDLSRVAVSLGPGSYTGLRIGIATVMGLKRSLGIDYIGVPLFDAVAAEVQDAMIAVPMGKTEVCFANSSEPGSSKVVSVDTFVESLGNGTSDRVVIHSALHNKFKDLGPGGREIEILGPSLAEYVGRAALSMPPSRSLDPIYVQNPRFG